MTADSPRPSLSPRGFSQLCATIVIAIILVLTGCDTASEEVDHGSTAAIHDNHPVKHG